MQNLAAVWPQSDLDLAIVDPHFYETLDEQVVRPGGTGCLKTGPRFTATGPGRSSSSTKTGSTRRDGMIATASSTYRGGSNVWRAYRKYSITHPSRSAAFTISSS